jgi:hypothetical protein
MEKKLSPPETFQLIFGFISLCAIFFGIWYWWTRPPELYIKKNEVKITISTLIANGADLDAIKHYYKGVNKFKWSFSYGITNEKNDHYQGDILLVTILKDIRNDWYIKNKPDQKEDGRILSLINEYEQRNPFDGLESSQRDYFENIRIKLGGNYSSVITEIGKISDELRIKNNLVNQYLADSKTSLYISIASIGFALLMAMVQIFTFVRRSKPSSK